MNTNDKKIIGGEVGEMAGEKSRCVKGGGGVNNHEYAALS